MLWRTLRTGIWRTNKMTNEIKSLAIGMVDRAGLQESSDCNAIARRTSNYRPIGIIRAFRDLANHSGKESLSQDWLFSAAVRRRSGKTPGLSPLLGESVGKTGAAL